MEESIVEQDAVDQKDAVHEDLVEDAHLEAEKANQNPYLLFEKEPSS